MTASRTSRIVAGVVLFVLLSVIGGKGQSQETAVEVAMNAQKPLTLHVTVHSRSQTRVILYAYRLPWGSRNSMLLIPVNQNGQCVDNKVAAIDDPSPETLTIDPNGSISGDVDLRRVLPGLEKTLEVSSVHLYWAYKAPDELRIPQWSGGWILIPKRK